MQGKIVIFAIVIGLPTISFESYEDSYWGFWGHKLINKTAVFTLPVDLLPLYKSNIDYITEHAIDPDKRRYASPLEAVRHYIDLDVLDEYPFDHLPRNLPEAMAAYGAGHIVTKSNRDTLITWESDSLWSTILDATKKQQWIQELTIKTYQLLDEGSLVMPTIWLPPPYDKSDHELVFTERLTAYGILPYHLSLYQHRLTQAFEEKDWTLVIKLSTEMGHYVSDAHVPLHTTVNYNGQLTNQDGIHALWESRIPELFAEESYDLFVGQAQYIDDTDAYFWDIIIESHSHVRQVLDKEIEVRHTIERDQQFCFEERGRITTRLACREYAKAYQDAMSGMVEDRMRKSILAVGSSWYTAWVDGGSPQIHKQIKRLSSDTSSLVQIDSTFIDRVHDND